MITSDDRGALGAVAAPPHELRGGLGQVTGAGGGPGLAPLVSPAPLPNAVLGSGPGVSAGVLAPPAGPTLPDADPWAMARLIAQIANELGGGAAPPLAPPGAFTPALVAGGSSDAAEPSVSAAPAVPAAPSVPAAFAVPAALAAFIVPAAPSAPAAPPVPVAPSVSAASAVPAAAGAPDAPPPFSTWRFEGFDAGALQAPGDVSDSPFADLMRFPMLGELVSRDAAPNYAPDPAAPSLASDAGGPRAPAHEHSPVPQGLVRSLGGSVFDPYAVRRDFPILEERIHGKRLVWLDNAATTQKPRAVIERLARFYEHENSNVHRAAHTLAARATDAYESARGTVRRFLGAPSNEEIVFVRGATEGINLIAKSWGRRNVGPGDEIVITWLEHHANIVPWQQLCAERGARLRVAPVDDRGDVILEEYERLLGPKTRLVAFPHVSNALGTVTPAREMVAMAHRHGALALVDGAQAVSHLRVDVQQLDCDFYVFSGHKVFAPTGTGAVYGKREVLAAMPPWQGGGNMIQDVTFERTVYHAPPWRFEAGTGSIADAAGLGAALDYLTGLGLENVARHEHDLLVYATERLGAVPGLRLVGTSPTKAGVLSFVLDGQRTEEVGAALDREGIAVRSGHHCAQPILRRYGLESTVRASLAPYNVCEDIDALVDALVRLQAGRGRPG